MWSQLMVLTISADDWKSEHADGKEYKKNDVDRDQQSEEAKLLATEKKNVPDLAN